MIRLGVTGLKKTEFLCFLDLFGGRRKRGGGMGLFSVCDDWANSGCVDVLVWYKFKYGEYGFSSIESWYYSTEWV